MLGALLNLSVETTNANVGVADGRSKGDPMKTLTKTALVFLALVIGAMSGAAQPAATTGAQQRAIVVSEAPPEGAIVGNKNSKKYHRPDCPGYRDMAERKRVFFKSVAEAEAAGYKLAGNCPAEVIVVVVKDAPSDPVVRPVPIPTDPSPRSPAAPPVLLDSNILTAVQTSPGKIIGNKNSKIYDVPGCSTYNSVSDKNRVLFNTSEDAEKAGYRKAKNCR
jgi:methylphosphotriester-DNA--protein-cysteine methyltransferase